MIMAARVEKLLNQLNKQSDGSSAALKAESCASKSRPSHKELRAKWYDPSVNVKELRRILDHDNIAMRDVLRQLLESDPIFIPQFHLSLPQERELALQRLKKFTDTKLFSVKNFIDNPRAIFAAHEMVQTLYKHMIMHILSSLTKIGRICGWQYGDENDGSI